MAMLHPNRHHSIPTQTSLQVHDVVEITMPTSKFKGTVGKVIEVGWFFDANKQRNVSTCVVSFVDKHGKHVRLRYRQSNVKKL